MAVNTVVAGPVGSKSQSSQSGDLCKEPHAEQAACVPQNVCEERHDMDALGKSTSSVLPATSGNIKDSLVSEKPKTDLSHRNGYLFEQADATHQPDCNSAEVDILEFVDFDNQRHDSFDQATECSSSFESTDSEFESEPGVDQVVRGVEVDSELRDGNGASGPQEDEAAGTPNEKKALDADWKSYRRGIEWRCRWLEVRMQELQLQAIRYDQILEELRRAKTWKLDKVNGEVSAARTIPLSSTPKKHQIFCRKRQRKQVESIDIDSYMARHPLFSRYAIKPETVPEEENPVEQPVVVHGVVELESMEQLLWQIEALQARVEKAKRQLNRGLIPNQNSLIVSPNSVMPNLSSQGVQVTPQTLSMPASSPLRVPITDTSVVNPVLSDSNLASASSGNELVQKRPSDYNGDNTTMSTNVGLKYDEQIQHVHIKTPQGRLMEDVDLVEQTQIISSDEGTDDAHFHTRHAITEVKEHQQQSVPSTIKRILDADSMSVARDGVTFGIGKGDAKILTKLKREETTLDLPSVTVSTPAKITNTIPPLKTVDLFPKRQRSKREPTPRSVVPSTNQDGPLYSQIEPQNFRVIKIEATSFSDAPKNESGGPSNS
ncbi:unnamed protein product [Sphagnum jensenii]|uniref:Uncharacterized protein n=1 Tax=Sphagnum jensenii TaxID=128206 RepID=A0ABP0W0W0_9BRYO